MDNINISNWITSIPQYKQLMTALFLVFVGCSAGYIITESNDSNAGTHEFDIFSYQAQEIDASMNSAFLNPSENNLRSVNNKLAVIEWRWLSQTEGDNKELFTAYLHECQYVIDEMQAGETPNLTKMNKLKNELM